MISRRTFVAACAAAPLLKMPSGLDREPPRRFGLRYGLVWSRGRQFDDGTWRIAIGVYEQRKRIDGDVCFREFHPSPKFISLLRRNGIQAVRSRVQPTLVASSATLPHGAIGFALLLEQIAPLGQQQELFVDPQPDGWGDYTIRTPHERILEVKRIQKCRLIIGCKT